MDPRDPRYAGVLRKSMAELKEALIEQGKWEVRSEAAKKGWRTRKAKEAEAKRLRRHSSKRRIEKAVPPGKFTNSD